MPIISWAHSHYWAAAAEPGAATEIVPAQYPAWQSSVTIMSGWGHLQFAWVMLRTWLRRGQ